MGSKADGLFEDNSYRSGWFAGKGFRRVGYDGNPRTSYTSANTYGTAAATSSSTAANAPSPSTAAHATTTPANVPYVKESFGTGIELFATRAASGTFETGEAAG